MSQIEGAVTAEGTILEVAVEAPSNAGRRAIRNRSAQIGGSVLLVMVLGAVLGPLIYGQDPIQPQTAVALRAPSGEHLLGTDALGRDLLARIMHGTQTSLIIAGSAVGIAAVVGTLIGMIAGYAQGVIDPVIMRIVDVFLAFPALLFAMVVISILGPGVVSLIVAVSTALTWQYVRVVRAAVLGIKQQDFVDSARALGCSHRRVVFRHILPNTIPTVIVLSTVGVAFAILSAASLSYLGLGPQPPTPELGAMLAEGQLYIQQAWWLTVPAGLVILGLTLAVNVLGDGLRDALDPRLRG